VKLVELSGPGGKNERVETGAFLPVEANFWSPDHTRYTLFFDPGRVKEGIYPNRQSGRPLRAGHQYVLDIASTWTDANGQPMKAAYRHAFRVGPAVDKAIATSEWTVTRPAAGTRDRLVVKFPRPLDHGILARALGVEAAQARRIDGESAWRRMTPVWTFTPVAPWPSGEYNLVAQSFLEDPQGNQIGACVRSVCRRTEDRCASRGSLKARDPTAPFGSPSLSEFHDQHIVLWTLKNRENHRTREGNRRRDQAED